MKKTDFVEPGNFSQSWPTDPFRCCLLRCQEIFCFRSPDGVQAQSGFGALWMSHVNPGIFSLVFGLTVLVNQCGVEENLSGGVFSNRPKVGFAKA